MNKRRIGEVYELKAAEYLKNKGIKITDRNFRSRSGEIDLVGMDGKTLVFIEVKYRKTASLGNPAEAVNISKQRTICRVSDYYRVCKKTPANTSVRYDVVAIEGLKITWYKNAFEYT